MGRAPSSGSSYSPDFRASSGVEPQGDDKRVARKGWHTECEAPGFIERIGARGLEKVKVGCGKCRHCLWTRRQSVANSVAMETETSDWALWVTLTIAPWDNPDYGNGVQHDYASRIEPSLIQNFQKRIRINRVRRVKSFLGRDCTSWRYMQAGEYGSKKGRAHFHCVIFGKGDRPIWGDNPDPKANIRIEEWPWGHCNVNGVVDGGVGFYLAGYMKKGGNQWSSCSCMPSIGAEFVRDLGKRLAEEGAPVPTSNWNLTMPYGSKGRKALLRGAKRRELVLAFCAARDCTPIQLAVKCAPVMYASLVRMEADLLVRAHKAREGVAAGVHRTARYVLECWADLRDLLGIPQDAHLRRGNPGKPAGWVPPVRPRGTGEAGRINLKRWDPNWPSRNTEMTVTHRQSEWSDPAFALRFKRRAQSDALRRNQPRVSVLERLEAAYQAKFLAPECSCADCLRNYGGMMHETAAG